MLEQPVLGSIQMQEQLQVPGSIQKLAHRMMEQLQLLEQIRTEDLVPVLAQIQKRVQSLTGERNQK